MTYYIQGARRHYLDSDEGETRPIALAIEARDANEAFAIIEGIAFAFSQFNFTFELYTLSKSKTRGTEYERVR